MPRQSEPVSESNTLPPADLNPLINPLLAENMGRWAEVYFTSPPESREQAVIDLLRELEAEQSRREAALASDVSSQPVLVRCHNCGHDNPTSNRFCGMCGAAMNNEGFRPGEDSGSHQRDAQEGPRAETEVWSDLSRSYDEPAAPRHELSLFQAYRGSDSEDEPENWIYEPAPSSSYRGYLGVVLAILILGLGYMAWRGMQNSSNSHQVSAPPPVAAKEAPPETPPPAATKSEAPSSTTAANVPPEATAAGASETGPSNAARPEVATKQPEAKTEQPAPSSNKPEATASNRDEAAGDSAKPPESPADKWGAEELAVAQRYLNGTTGQRRDTAEAARWLWKSIAKHNGTATLLLADLYLRGDGVSKNCDQARVLLDSAARKGVSGAGQRLRNLQAFGCQ